MAAHSQEPPLADVVDISTNAQAESETEGDMGIKSMTIESGGHSVTIDEESAPRIHEHISRLLADPETGEIKGQMSFAGDAFVRPIPKRQVPMTKVSFSGSEDMATTAFGEMTNGHQLADGLVVYARVRAYLPEPHTKWVKRSEGSGDDKQVWWEPEGQVKIKVLEVEELEITDEVYSDEE